MISKLMTPRHILEQTDFPVAQMILPEYFPDFKSLLVVKDDIRDLKILPIKTQSTRNYYNSVKDSLLSELLEDMGSNEMFFAINKFPYFLPAEIKQGLLWVKDGVPDQQVELFIVEHLQSQNIALSDTVIFERPKNAKTALVKGTFAAMRHIHIWSL